ncbi:MAG: M20 family metallopeptidase [Trueperaceae bacterium]
MSRSVILEHAYASEEAFLSTLEALVTRESPTSSKVLCDALADYLQHEFQSDGWTVTRHARASVGDILEAHMPGADGPSTLILTHYDTVWPEGTLAEMPWKRDGDQVFGPGVLDMKAGIANAITAVRLTQAARIPLAGNVTLLATSDEETGSHHSQELIEKLAKEHDRVLVLEPGREDGALKTGRKGTGSFHVRFRGRSAHAGNNPADGASALRELAHFLLYVEDHADEVAGTTINLTVARGGIATNVIAEEAEAFVDLRVLKASEAERVERVVHGYTPRDTRVALSIAGGLNRPPLELTAANEELFDEAQTALDELGLKADGAVVGGGSDGNFTSALGIATLDGLGSVGAGPHARHEHIRIRDTLARVALVTGLLTRG